MTQNLSIEKLIELSEKCVIRVRYNSRLVYMDKVHGEFKGVKWRSLNPTSQQIRAKDIERACKNLRKPLHEVYPDSLHLIMLLNKPVERLKYYQRSRQRIR